MEKHDKKNQVLYRNYGTVWKVNVLKIEVANKTDPRQKKKDLCGHVNTTPWYKHGAHNIRFVWHMMC